MHIPLVVNDMMGTWSKGCPLQLCWRKSTDCRCGKGLPGSKGRQSLAFRGVHVWLSLSLFRPGLRWEMFWMSCVESQSMTPHTGRFAAPCLDLCVVSQLCLLSLPTAEANSNGKVSRCHWANSSEGKWYHSVSCIISSHTLKPET